VSVSSATGSPGLSRTKGRKTVVVCVVVVVVLPKTRNTLKISPVHR